MFERDEDEGGEGEAEAAPRSLRLLMLIEEVARVGVPSTPTEINKTVGLPKQTLHRSFATLEEWGFLQREHDGRSYSPGPRMRSMSLGVLSSTRIRSARLAVMNRLAEDIGETCNLVIPGRDSMIYLDRVETKWPLRIQLPVGTRVPFHCTASGKLFLSTLNQVRLERLLNNLKLERMTAKTKTTKKALLGEVERIRQEGHSEDDEEFIAAMVAVAVPIFDERKRLVSVLAVHAPTPRLSLSQARGFLPRISRAAEELSELLVESI